MRTLDIKAENENLDKVIAFVDELLEENDCSIKIQMAVELTVEEIFVNISNYAYTPAVGDAKISADVSGEPKKLTIVFEDSGVPYDPLAKEDPDVTLPASERSIGGLGIYLVKKNMDNVTYEHRDGKNILTVEKVIEG